RAELPDADDWIQELQSARQKPCPFTVTQVDQSLVRNWSALLEKKYLRNYCKHFMLLIFLSVLLFLSPLPVSKEKYKDLQQLKKFCGEEARGFYEKLPRKD
ncbi:hypothetical protein ANN_26556, partial [Periplaneta americana]